MIITRAHAKNFQSYETINFSYDTLGLTLISGPTGAGKSTLLDLVPWTLYGQTSKDGASDDVCSWHSNDPTTASVSVQLPSGAIIVTRTRGRVNDLYWLELDGSTLNGGNTNLNRGKDLKDTQKLLEARLGVSAEMFITGSYLTQFSKADSFFIASAKERRTVLEQISDQEWAIKLGERTSEARKEAKKSVSILENKLSIVTGKLEAHKSTLESLIRSQKQWELKQAGKISDCITNLNNYEADQSQKFLDWAAAAGKKLSVLEAKRDEAALKIVPADSLAEQMGRLEAALEELGAGKCSKCGAPNYSEERHKLERDIQELQHKHSESGEAEKWCKHYEYEIKTLSTLEYVPASNSWKRELDSLTEESNPFEVNVLYTQTKIGTATAEQLWFSQDLGETQVKLSQLNWIYDKSFELRGILMERAVTQIQDKTNYYLEKFFDAAIRVNLVLAGSDKLEVEITNNGHLCPFTSMSGGERCMLKLAFSLSLMSAAQDKAGVAFGMIMLDEPLSGLDESLRVKAYGLLEELAIEYPTVLAIEHSESFKSMFSNVISITKENGVSSILSNE